MSVGEAVATDPRRRMPGHQSPNPKCVQGTSAPDIVGEKPDGSKVGLGQRGGRYSAVGLVARRK